MIHKDPAELIEIFHLDRSDRSSKPCRMNTKVSNGTDQYLELFLCSKGFLRVLKQKG